jgi:NAD(P)-dependent dehydrogenase (short-subunit alcohol dehydrogenase family)
MIRPLVTSLVYLDGVQREFYHHGADLCDPTQISDMFQFIKSRYNRGPDILVNNAGMQYVEPIEKMPVEKWDQVLAVNLSASFHTIRLALPGMRERDAVQLDDVLPMQVGEGLSTSLQFMDLLGLR